MLNEAQVQATMSRMATAFLANQRVNGGEEGWGQFVGPNANNQIGLYGICSGIIAISIALPNSAIPAPVIATVEALWRDRADPSTKGPRYFSLTCRLAFLLLALRVSRNAKLQILIPEVERELELRIAPDGLFYDWYVAPATNSASGDNYTTSIALLAYGLSSTYGPPPTFIKTASSTLLSRIKGAHDQTQAFRRLYLTAIAMTLPASEMSSVKPLVREELSGRKSTASNYLYFWDYKYQSGARFENHRDYFYVPPEVVDVLLAANDVSRTMQKLAAIDILQKFWSLIEPSPSGLYYRQGADLAASKEQAWIALALSKASLLMKVEGLFSRAWMRVITGTTNNWIMNAAFPIVLLLALAALSDKPDYALTILQHFGYLTQPPEWWPSTSQVIKWIGIALLSAIGQTLWNRAITFVRARLI